MLLAINCQQHQHRVRACSTAHEKRGSLAHLDRRAAHRRRICRLADAAAWRSRTCRAPGYRRRDHRQRRAADQLQPAHAVPALFRRRADGRRRPGAQARHQGADRPARRRPAPTASSTPSPRTTATRCPLIVIDFGTATTFDVVDGDGNYLGGVIAPGINLSLRGAAHGGREAAARARSAGRRR